MIRRVLVVGGGSAGWLAAITLKKRLPELAVTVLHSRELGIIGVGEGTTPTTPRHLHGYLGIDLAEFYREARPTWKLGIHFRWGSRSAFNYTFRSQFDSQYRALAKPTGFYADDDMLDLDIACALMNADRVFERMPNGAPYVGVDAAYHLENETFVGFLEKYGTKLGVQQIDGLIAGVELGEAGVTGLRLNSGAVHTADLYVDCSGFRSLLLGGNLQERFESFASSLFCDRAIVGGWDRPAGEHIHPYTTSEAMPAGWMWQIDHEDRIHRGYVFSSAFLSDDEAERQYREKCPRAGQTRFVPFRSGRYARLWVKNVVAIGNASGFVEPLEATALAVICNQSQTLAETVAEADTGEVTPTLKREFNLRFEREWNSIRRFLALHYKFNTQFETPFWRECRDAVDLAGAEPLVEYFQENGPGLLYRESMLEAGDPFRIDGYWTMLIGQQVPYRNHHRVSPQELEIVSQIRMACRRKAQQGYSSEDALRVIRSPAWQWDMNFYRKEYGMAPR